MIKRCVIITAFVDGNISEIYQKESSDYIICADGGTQIAEKGGIVPDIVLGDLDSANVIDEKYDFIKFPKEKDDTDTMLCLKYGIDKGFDNFVIIGGIGGRFDHTIANIQTLAYAKEHNVTAKLISKDAECFFLWEKDSCELNKKDGFYLSVFSYSEKCTGVTIKGTKYPLENGELTNTFPLGVSNEITENKAYISLDKGKLLVILARG